MKPYKIRCLNVSYYCHPLYQAMVGYAHIHQQSDKYLENSVDSATDKVFYDSLYVAIPYTLLLERLPDPPDGALKSMLSLIFIIFVYFYPVVRGLILHWSRSIFDSFLAKDNKNVFVRHGISRPEK